MNAQSPSSSASSAPESSSGHGWKVTVFCTLVTAGGAFYTATASFKSQTEIEALKRDSEQKIAQIKSDSERAIKESELKTQENVIRLKEQFDQEKDFRAKTTAEEASARASVVARCGEIKVIHSQMSEDIPHIRYNDSLTDSALTRLEVNYNKLTLYLSRAGLDSLKASRANKIPSDELQMKKYFYTGVLDAYMAELRAGC